jgi:acyl-CoA synthetase (AMP-forming)/AMP-acid ligase II
VCAVVAPVAGGSGSDAGTGSGPGEPTLDDLAAHVRRRLAGYKVPKRLVVVDSIVRSPSGKADYRWAAGVATKAVVE